jgi:hypothetical protein
MNFVAGPADRTALRMSDAGSATVSESSSQQQYSNSSWSPAIWNGLDKL